jgi:hypothetical protein
MFMLAAKRVNLKSLHREIMPESTRFKTQMACLNFP